MSARHRCGVRAVCLRAGGARCIAGDARVGSLDYLDVQALKGRGRLHGSRGIGGKRGRIGGDAHDKTARHVERAAVLISLNVLGVGSSREEQDERGERQRHSAPHECGAGEEWF